MSSVGREIIRAVEASLVREGQERGIVKGYRVYLLRQLRLRFGSQVDDDTVWRLGEAGSE